MLSGAHMIIYSRDADADRVFLRDVLGLSAVDEGGGWLIFQLPPSELGVHPFEKNDEHEIFFLVKDVRAFVEQMRAKQVTCSALQEQTWGLLTKVTLPGGGTIGVYEPKHARPAQR